MQKRDGAGKVKHHKCQQPPHPKGTARCRDHRDTQGQETIPPIAGSNLVKEDPTPVLSQGATWKCAS